MIADETWTGQTYNECRILYVVLTITGMVGIEERMAELFQNDMKHLLLPHLTI